MKGYGHGRMMGGKMSSGKSMSAGKIHPTSGTPLAGNSAGSNVMLRKNTAGSTPTQKGMRDFGVKGTIRVPATLKSGRGR